MKSIVVYFIGFLSIYTVNFTQDTWFWQNPLPQGNALSDISFFDSNNLIAVGFNGTIIRSFDGGDVWSPPIYIDKQVFLFFYFHLQLKSLLGSWIKLGNIFKPDNQVN